MFKVLQLAFLVMMVTFCVTGEVWRRPSPAEEYGFSLWTEGPPDGAVLQSNVTHCVDAQSYSFNYSSRLTYSPQGCKVLPREEAATEAGIAGEVFISTFIEDTAAWRGQGAACSNSVQQACEGSSLGGVYTASGGSCSCTTHEEYFARDAQEQQIIFSHGYEVDTSAGHGLHVMRGSSLTQRALEGPQGQMWETSVAMTTIFQKSDGTRCQVGGRLEWSNADAAEGIAGTLGELLACAGLSLDSDPRSLLASSAGLAPHFRTMGLSLELRLTYENSIWAPGVVCYVRVTAVPVWTRKQFMDVVRLPIPSGEHLAKQSRNVMGVTITMKAAGQFYSFDFAKLVSAFASLLVMVQVPRYITQFVALYCLGLMSNIYRNAKRAKLNIFEHFHGACARMMLAEVGFRGLMGGKWSGKVADMPGITEDMLLKRLTSVFHEHMVAGILQKDEIRKMAHVIFAKMDLGKRGVVSCSDYIHSCTANETIDISSMARFFDDDKKVGFVQQYFDDTDDLRKSYTSETVMGDEDTRDFDVTMSEDESVGVSPAYRRNSCVAGNGGRRASIAAIGNQAMQANGSPRLEADEIRQIVAMGLQQVNDRMQALENEGLPGRVAELSKKVDNALSKAMHACRVVAKKDEDATGKEAQEARELEEGANRVKLVTSRVQQLEEEVSLLHTNLEARTLQLEEVALQEVTRDLRHRTEETRKYCDERLRSIEAALKMQTTGRSSLECPPPIEVGSAAEPSPADSQAMIPGNATPVPEIAPTHGKMSFPSREDWKPAPSPSPTHPCFARTLVKSPANTPAPSRGSSEPPTRSDAAAEDEGRLGWLKALKLN